MDRLKGKRIVITGSSRSLGRHFALACAAEGASLIVNGTNEEALADVAREVADLGVAVHAVLGSVAETEVCNALVETCVDKFGGIDVMVNNAGIVRDRTLIKMSDEDFDEVIAVNLRGPFLCTRSAAVAMKAQGSGHIIQITSASGLVGNFGQTNYAAAKAGLMGMMYTAAKELGRYNIRCNAMWPVARTDMTQPLIDHSDATALELGFGEPEDVAMGLVWLASDAAERFNSQCLTFNGLKTALWRSPSEDYIKQEQQAISIEELEGYYAELSPIPIYSSRG
ncbi:SDR family NAD(P)-dependent oxidoreductase [Halioglobus sp. Uisw_031]|jgi:NAD(P)-dependent dehydrogenase (short-subunit alcohol dehydrogenase family)|uniref:SDR family NAD(P)-dependent oxidoreductase n=1 Tax=Halioglobus sp. Uisw_031 TaxID=3230977 RepID=UPI0039EBE129